MVGNEVPSCSGTRFEWSPQSGASLTLGSVIWFDGSRGALWKTRFEFGRRILPGRVILAQDLRHVKNVADVSVLNRKATAVCMWGITLRRGELFARIAIARTVFRRGNMFCRDKGLTATSSYGGPFLILAAGDR